MHSILIILQSYPGLLAFVVPFFSSNSDVIKPALLVLPLLKNQINLTRRYLRTFKFFEPYVLAYNLATDTTGPKSLETYLDIMYGSLMGLFGMIETATLLDIAGIPGLQIFGPERTVYLNIEAQRFWLFGLACSVLSGGIKLIKLFAHAPVPSSGDGYGAGADIAEADKQAVSEKEGGKEEELKAERERLRNVVAHRKQHRRELQRKARLLTRKMLADSLDMIIPLGAVGWYLAEPGVVGSVMLATSFLTSLDTWEKHGRQLEQQGK